MEIEGEDGTKMSLKPGIKAVFGRGNLFNTKDRTVSRRHVLFELKTPAGKTDTETEPRVSFEVLGKNPIWVRNQRNREIKVFKKFENGEVAADDWLCVSSQSPFWFTLKRNEIETEGGERTVVEDDSRLDCLDISDIDPAKEFGFLVMGKEFDQYPKERIRDIKNWNWFLEEPKKDRDNDDDDDGDEGIGKGKRNARRNRRKSEGNEDDDWTSESDDDEGLIAKVRKVQRPTYSTRSTDCKKPKRDAKKSRSFVQRRGGNAEEEEDEIDDEDTLGGFIVDDDDDVQVEEESDLDDDEEEEEEFDEDDDDE